MNYFQRLPMYLRFGSITMAGFKTRLALRIARIMKDDCYRNTRERDFIEGPELKQFCRDEVTYQWHLANLQPGGGGTGTIPYGPVTNLRGIEAYMAKSRPNLEVVFIDHNLHFIFTRSRQL